MNRITFITWNILIEDIVGGEITDTRDFESVED